MTSPDIGQNRKKPSTLNVHDVKYELKTPNTGKYDDSFVTEDDRNFDEYSNV